MTVRLTKKQKGFVKDFIITDNATVAIKQNYDVANDNSAAVLGSEMLRNPKIQTAIQDALPDELLAKVHLEGLQATKKSGVGGMLLSLKGKGKGTFGHTDIEEPDYAVRHKYLDSAYKIKGAYAPDKSLNVDVAVDYDPKLAQDFDAYIKDRLTQSRT